MRRTLEGGYELDDDGGRIDRRAVHRFISEQSYWAAGRPRDAMDGLIERVRDYRRLERAYASRTAPAFAQRSVSDYDHLARVAEWSTSGEEEGE